MSKSTNNKKSPTTKTSTPKPATSDMAPEESTIAATSAETEDGLSKLFLDGIKDIYWAENALVKALPKMSKSAWSPDLKAAIDNHLSQTKTHVDRLEQIFGILGKGLQAKKCDAMEGLTKEGEGIIENTDKDTPARDLGIIMASQKVEHYEIATYGGLSQLAKTIGHEDISAILEQTLAEEKEADQALSDIATNFSSAHLLKN